MDTPEELVEAAKLLTSPKSTPFTLGQEHPEEFQLVTIYGKVVKECIRWSTNPFASWYGRNIDDLAFRFS
ncbi:hypothetical protein SKAU_G00375720 [Synaphobranchus kaupii]|uniref:Uncharacterized protein n=1 Tax=Synaphobranchus kaupii TaxID=118154 RepID=A0A9Q1EGY4_SYNKA|nr:hypothetical protein SKAU_G00375720 [Synaphobranchus kaupii]